MTAHGRVPIGDDIGARERNQQHNSDNPQERSCGQQLQKPISSGASRREAHAIGCFTKVGMVSIGV